MSKDPKALPPNRARFVEEYLVDLNATQAAIRAGYSKRTARQQGARLLTNVAVAAAVATGKAKRTEQSGITAAAVVEELKALAHSDVTHYVVDNNGNLSLAAGAPANAMRAVSSIKHRITKTGSGKSTRTTHEVELKLWDKPGPLKLAGRHADVHGFAERVEMTGKDGRPIEVEAKVSFYIPQNGRGRS